MIRRMRKLYGLTGFLLIPCLLRAQSTVAEEINGLQSVLDSIYTEMLPLCGSLIGIGQGIAGFAAIWYIGVRVWRHIARAEPIDIFPLFRPFVLGFAIMIFPSVIDMINGALQPTVTATGSLVTNSNQAIADLLQQKQEAVERGDFYKMYIGPDGNGDRDQWYQYTHPDDTTASNEGVFEGLGDDIKFEMAKLGYNFRNGIREWISEILQILFEAAALCINTIRSFHLIILAILGPLVFGLAVFDGFQRSLTSWLARYIQIFLWLPVANLLGALIGLIEQQMIRLDINQVQSSGDTYFSQTDTGYLIFLIIGIAGYFTVPSIAGYIVEAGGSNSLLRKTNSWFGATAVAAISVAHSGFEGSSPPTNHPAGRHFLTSVSPGGEEGHSLKRFLAKKISGDPESGEIDRRNS